MSNLIDKLFCLPISHIKRIFPSRFSQFQQCTLREIWSLNHQISLLPCHPYAKLGSISHAVLEAATKGVANDRTSLEALWNDVTKKVQDEMLQSQVEEHLVPLEIYAFNYEVKKILCFKMAEQIIEKSGSGACRDMGIEQWFESADGKIAGKVDLILTHDDGIEIVDYKTGNIFNSQYGGIKDEYEVQMKLYAGLYHEVKDDWPVKLSLIGIDGKKYYVSFNKKECEALINQARKVVDETNELIDAGLISEDFANPSPSTCKYCSYRPACKKYWLSRESSKKWPCDVIGEVIEKSLLGNGLFRVVINDNDREYVIRGLSAKRHKFLNDDIHDVLFCNLGQDSLDGYYIEQLLTTGYLLNNDKKKA